MVDKIKDITTGGTYETGNPVEFFYPRDGRLGVTGKFNALVDEIGDLTSLTTDDVTSIVNAINEIDSNTDASVKLDSTPQTLTGTYTFGSTTGTSDTVMFNHDVEFFGSVAFSGGGGNVLDLSNTFISLGDDESLTPVGDGGVILERGFGLEDARIFWDESTLEWKVKEGEVDSYAIIHKGITDTNALSYILTGNLNALDIELISNNPFARLVKSSGNLNAKTWDLKVSNTNDDFVINTVSDDLSVTQQAYRINRTSTIVNNHSFYTNNIERFKIDTSNLTSNLPIKVDTILENTLNNGVLIDTLKIKDEGIYNGSLELVRFSNTGNVFNPNSQNINFTINGNGSQAFEILANTSRINNNYDTYLNQSLYVENIRQLNSNGIVFNNKSTVKNDLFVETVAPQIFFNETDQTTDSKLWKFRANGGQFGFGTVNDANTVYNPSFVSTRTENTTTKHDFYLNGNIESSLSSMNYTFGNSSVSSDLNFNIDGNTTRDINLSFKQANSIKALIQYDDSENEFTIKRYRNTDQVLLSSIDFTESSTDITGLPVNITDALNVNFINPYSNTSVSINSSVNISGSLAINGDNIYFGTTTDTQDRITFDDATNEFTFYEGNTILNSIVRAGRFLSYNDSLALDQKTNRISVNSSGNFTIDSLSDDRSTASPLYIATKSGLNTTSHNFYVNGTNVFNFDETRFNFGNITNNNLTRVDINSKDGYDSQLRFNNNNILRGVLLYDDSRDVFGLYHYLNGTYSCALDMTTNSITVADADLTVERNLYIDDIFERTTNHGINFEGVIAKDGNLQLSASSYIHSTGSLSFICDSDNNSTSNGFIWYNNSYDDNNRLMLLLDEGELQLFNNTGTGLRLFRMTSNPNDTVYMDFRYAVSSTSSSTRLGYVGFGSTSNQDLYVLADNGSVRLQGTSIDLNPLSDQIFTNGASILMTATSGLIYDNGNIRQRQLSSSTNYASIESVGSVVFAIDTNNNSTTTSFQWRHNNAGTSGTTLMSLSESGVLSLQNNDIHIGTGALSFATYNSDYITFDDTTNQFRFFADGSITNSVLVSDNYAFNTTGQDYITFTDSNSTFSFVANGSTANATVLANKVDCTTIEVAGNQTTHLNNKSTFTPTFNGAPSASIRQGWAVRNGDFVEGFIYISGTAAQRASLASGTVLTIGNIPWVSELTTDRKSMCQVIEENGTYYYEDRAESSSGIINPTSGVIQLFHYIEHGRDIKTSDEWASGDFIFRIKFSFICG